MKTNPKLVSVLTLIYLVFLSRFVFAATVLPPFSQDVRGFDFESAIYAAVAGLLGGAGRTIYSLASEKILVGNLWREGLKDAILALIGGVVTWAIVTYLANYWPGVLTPWARMLLIFAAGASRGRWANILGDFVSDGLGALKIRFARWLRGGNDDRPPEDPPPSAVAPLESTK